MSKTYLKSDHFNGGGSPDFLQIADFAGTIPLNQEMAVPASAVGAIDAGASAFALGLELSG